jgi:hypothetical protein
MKNFETLPLYDKLLKKIYAYYQTIWKEKWKEGIDKDWLNNFHNDDDDVVYKERLNMLYLLSKFMYFGNDELRQLLLSLYRDLYKYPIVSEIRKRNGNTIDVESINREFINELNATKFLGVGNPSESGVHMLYYFRQECNLSKSFFINTSEIFTTKKATEVLPDGKKRIYLETKINDTAIKRYVFIDDFCGSGDQASGYLKEIVTNIKLQDRTIEVNYLMLFSTEQGIATVQKLGIFNNVNAVFTIDDTFKTFSDSSRYFSSTPDIIIEKGFSKSIASKYGNALFSPSLGHGDCQLLLGLFHNTPDNSLPIFWSDKNNWKPIFKRYNKKY